MKAQGIANIIKKLAPPGLAYEGEAIGLGLTVARKLDLVVSHDW